GGWPGPQDRSAEKRCGNPPGGYPVSRVRGRVAPSSALRAPSPRRAEGDGGGLRPAAMLRRGSQAVALAPRSGGGGGVRGLRWPRPPPHPPFGHLLPGGEKGGLSSAERDNRRGGDTRSPSPHREEGWGEGVARCASRGVTSFRVTALRLPSAIRSS